MRILSLLTLLTPNKQYSRARTHLIIIHFHPKIQFAFATFLSAPTSAPSPCSPHTIKMENMSQMQTEGEAKNENIEPYIRTYGSRHTATSHIK